MGDGWFGRPEAERGGLGRYRTLNLPGFYYSGTVRA